MIRCATENPASALKRPELGTFRQGGVGDASVLALETGKFDYVDAVGEHLEGNMRLYARGLVIGGDWLDSPEVMSRAQSNLSVASCLPLRIVDLMARFDPSAGNGGSWRKADLVLPLQLKFTDH